MAHKKWHEYHRFVYQKQVIMSLPKAPDLPNVFPVHMEVIIGGDWYTIISIRMYVEEFNGKHKVSHVNYNCTKDARIIVQKNSFNTNE